MKKQKPAKKRGNLAKQRQKSAVGSARGKHVDPLTSLARTAGPGLAPQGTRGRKGAAAEPVRLGLPAALLPHKSRAQTKTAARALPQSYVWEDREAFAIVCAPFLILALWFTYQQTMRPFSPLPDIALHRDSSGPPPAVAMLPQTLTLPPSPMANPVEPVAPVAASTPPAVAATPAPVIDPLAREPEIARSAPAAAEPLPEPRAAPPVAETSPAPSAHTAATIETTAAPGPAALSSAIEAPRAPAPTEALPLVASLAPEWPAPSALGATPEAPASPAEAAATALAVASSHPTSVEFDAGPAIRAENSLPERAESVASARPAPAPQQHAALAPIARSETPTQPAQTLAPAGPAMVPPREPSVPPASVPGSISPEAAPQTPTDPAASHESRPPAPAALAPPPARAFDICQAPATLFAPTQSAARVTPPPAPDFGLALARAARDQLTSLVIYNAKYARIGFPNGDVAPLFGVCTDVVVRAYRTLGVDLQQLIAEAKSGRGDRNIDHRRVEVMRRFLGLHGESLPISDFAEDYQPGDIVTYYRPQNRSSTQHIAIVSDIVAPSGRYMIVHNRGWGPQLEDGLFVDKITGHFRFAGMKKQPEPAPLIAAVMASATPWALTTAALTKRDAAEQLQRAAAVPATASSIASTEARVASINGQSKPVIASLGPEHASLCRPANVIIGALRTAEAQGMSSPSSVAAKSSAVAAKPAAAVIKTSHPATAKPAAPPATKPAQAKAPPKPLQKAATGTAAKPASL